MIFIGFTGPDWEGAPKYFAQRENGSYAFGDTPTEALMTLWWVELRIPVLKYKEWNR